MTPMIWTMRDRFGRTWQAAVNVDLLRSEGMNLELHEAGDLGLVTVDMRVVTVPVPVGMDID